MKKREKREENRNPFWDLLKGVLILNVIILHSPAADPVRHWILFPFVLEMTVPMFLVISGYVSAKSALRSGLDTLEEAYGWRRLLRKCLRFVVPFTMAYLAQWILFRVFGLYLVNLFRYGLFAFAMEYLAGGKGMGSYYFPLMIQFVFLFPIIFRLIQKKGIRGVWLCGLLNGAYEVLKTAYGMNETCYRLLIFRYLLVIAFGCYLAMEEWRPKLPALAACLLTGAGFLVAVQYLGYQPKVLNLWSGTCFVACLYLLPGAAALMAYGERRKEKYFVFRLRFLELLGRASFSIFLAQMIFFCLPIPLENDLGNGVMVLLAQMVICTVAGLLLYFVEKPVTDRILKRI